MTTQTLRRVTLQTLQNYSTAATQVVAAYRQGGHRVVAAVNGAFRSTVVPRTRKLTQGATDMAQDATVRINEVRGNVSEVLVKGIDRFAHRTERAIEAGSNAAAARVTQVAEFAAGVENPLVANSLQTVALLTMPGAKVALAVSGKLAERTHALADAVGARTAAKPTRKLATKRKAIARAPKASPAVRQAKANVNAASRRVTKAAKVVEAQAAKAPRQVRATRKAVAEVVAG
jgi:hypothetical protein